MKAEELDELERDLPEWEATEEMFRERHNNGLTGAQEAAVAMTLRRMLAAFPALLAAARENATLRELLTEASEAPTFIRHRYHCAAVSLDHEEREDVACTCGRMGLLARIDAALAAGRGGT